MFSYIALGNKSSCSCASIYISFYCFFAHIVKFLTCPAMELYGINFSTFYLNNFLCLKDLAISIAIFWPVLVREKKVAGSPLISFLCLKALNDRSNFRESGHWAYSEKLKVSGNKVKHSLISRSKSHFSLPEVTEYMENKIRRDFFIKFP